MGSNSIRREDLLNHVLFIKFVLILAILSKTMKTANLVLLILILFVLFAGCDKDKQAIRKDLNSRFTKFKIIDVIKDSSNVSDVMMTFKRLKIRIADNNREIIKSINDIKSGAASQKPYQTIFYIDSLYNNSIEGGMDLEIMQFDRSEPCYYVNYLIYKEGMKIPKEEYFYINESNGEVLHRPYDWCEFLLEFGYSVLLEDALLYHTDIFDLERKYKFNSLEH